MFLFRLLSLVLRIVGSFFLVFFLQINWNGKSLESRLNEFGKQFIVTRSLKKMSQDGAKLIRDVSPLHKGSEFLDNERHLSGESVNAYIKDLADRIKAPVKDKEETIEDSL